VATAAANKAAKEAEKQAAGEDVSPEAAELAVRVKELLARPVTDSALMALFTPSVPDAEQQQQIKMITRACSACAQVIRDNSNNCADRAAAIRHVREAKMTAVACVMHHGRI